MNGSSAGAVPTSAAATSVVLSISPGAVVRALGIAVAVLVAMHLLGTFSDEVLGRDSFFGIVPRFNLDNEQTVPAWFTSGVLLAGALLASVIGATLRSQGQPGLRRWLLLGLVLAFLSFDETMMVHESFSVWARGARVSSPTRLMVTTGLLGAFALAVVAAGASLLRGLPARIRWLALSSAALYVGGAVVVDKLTAPLLRRDGDSVGVYLLTLLEEVGELAGVVLALYTLLAYLAWLQQRGAATPESLVPGATHVGRP